MFDKFSLMSELGATFQASSISFGGKTPIRKPHEMNSAESPGIWYIIEKLILESVDWYRLLSVNNL